MIAKLFLSIMIILVRFNNYIDSVKVTVLVFPSKYATLAHFDL